MVRSPELRSNYYNIGKVYNTELEILIDPFQHLIYWRAPAERLLIHI
jgi:hypothetical protein